MNSARWRPTATTKTLRLRAELLHKTREFFRELDVLEVQTPVVAAHAVPDPAIESFAVKDGGFLQSSPEFHMKRLLCAGFPSCYQLGPAFRKGEQGRWHNPEFTMLEWYRIGFTASDLMLELTELIDLLIGPGVYETCTYRELFRHSFGLDGWLSHADEIAKTVSELGLLDVSDKEDQLDFLYDRALQKTSVDRLFVTEFPPHAAALAQIRSVAGVDVADRFELVVAGLEIGNGYNELLDADELEQRFARENSKRAKIRLPHITSDKRLLLAMREGLPACAGVAVGFDRVVALAAGVKDLSSAIAFAAKRA